MRFTLLLLLLSAFIVSVFAESASLESKGTESASPAIRHEELTNEQKAAARKEAVLRHFGGKIARPGSQKGKIVFINTTDLADTHINSVANTFASDLLYAITCIKTMPDAPKVLKEKAEANIAIVIVKNDDAPPLLVAPEEGWAQINLTKLSKGLPDNPLGKSMANTRARKELIRAFSLVCGGFGSPFKGSVINATSVEDLDICEEVVPFDTLQLYGKYLKGFGVTPREDVWYRNACKQGWAPAPTNDVQKAIWDKVHELPTEPIKIKPEEKKTEK